MNDSLIDKILLGAAVVLVLAAAAFFGISQIDWSPSGIATGGPTAITTPSAESGTPIPTPGEGTVLPAFETDTTQGSADGGTPAPTATALGQRPRVSTDYLLLTPEGAGDPSVVDQEPTQVVMPTEVIPTPEAIEPTIPGDPYAQPTDIPQFPVEQPTPQEFLTEATATADGFFAEGTPTPEFELTSVPIIVETAAPTIPPTATIPPLDVVSGTVSWTGLHAVTKDVLVTAGSVLIIEPNTTLTLSAGVSVYVDGTLRLNGTKAEPVYITNAAGAMSPWGGIYVRQDGVMTVNDSFIWNGGAAGTLLSVDQGTVRIADTEIKQNHGQIRLVDAVFLLQKSTVRDNDLSFGAMVDATYEANGRVLVENSRVGPNTGGSGTQIAIHQSGAMSELLVDLTGVNLVGKNGTNLVLVNDGTMKGAVTCSTFNGGDTAISVESSAPSVPGIGVTVHQSVFSGHKAPYGPPRVLVSNVAFDARTNWWNASSGPYHPKSNPSGTGEANGVNVNAGGWLTARPACAPIP